MPSGKKVISATRILCGGLGGSLGAKSRLRSCTSTVPRPPPLTSQRSSRLRANAVTPTEWPVKTRRRDFSRPDQTRIVESSLAVKVVTPSTVETSPVTLSAWPS